MPDSDLTVYRGCFPMFRFSLPWTTNNQCAEWFAREYSARRYVYPPDIAPWAAPPAVYRAKVAPRHILAMFYELEEEEVVVDPWGLARIEQIG